MQFNQAPQKLHIAPEDQGKGMEKVPQELPIDSYKEDILETVENNSSTILVGETGSGKTTRTPLFLLEKFPNARIAVTSPRVLPARSVSKYVAKERGERVGETVGLITRDDRKIEESTRLTFMTDGVLLNMLRNDPMLLDLDIVMVDEAHERSINIDLLLGLLKYALKLRREKGETELKILVASATIEEEKFANYFDESPVTKVPGRIYPIQTKFHDLSNLEEDVTLSAARLASKLAEETSSGDILVFMPGEEEIRRTIKEIELRVGDTAMVLPLYGSMKPEDQDKIFEQYGKRKIIVSTNIAETSVTIDGVAHVIDSGYAKEMRYRPDTGINSLDIIEVSQANMNQRKGRAGRTGPGTYHPLIGEEEFNKRQAFQIPEILRTDLGELVLRMKEMGINDVEGFDFIDKPNPKFIHDAIMNLTELGALDDNGEITELGREMRKFELRPDLSRMLVEAKHLGCLPEMVDLCAILATGKPVFVDKRVKDATFEQQQNQDSLRIGGSDPLTLLNVWGRWMESDWDMTFAKDHLLNNKTLREIGGTRLQLLKALRNGGEQVYEGDYNIDDKEILVKIIKCILSGNPDALFYSSDYGRTYGPVKMDSSLYRSFLFDGVKIHPASSAFKAGDTVILALDVKETTTTKESRWGGPPEKVKNTWARFCQNLNLEMLKKILPAEAIKEEIGRDFGLGYKKKDIYIYGRRVYSETIYEERNDDPYEYRRSTRLNYLLHSRQEKTPEFEATPSTIEFVVPDLYQNNRDVQWQVRDYLERTKKINLSHELSLPLDDIYGYYALQIAKLNIKTREDVEKHKEAFMLHFRTFISDEQKKEIDADCPIAIMGGGTTFGITYKKDIAGKRVATCTIESQQDIEKFLQADLPSFTAMDKITYSVSYWPETTTTSFRSIPKKITTTFDSLEDLRAYYEQYKRGEEKRARRHERKAEEPTPVRMLAKKKDEKPAPIRVAPENKEIVENISLEINDIRTLLGELRRITQAVDARQIKDKEKILERIKEISSRTADVSKNLEQTGGDMDKGTQAELIQALRAIAKRLDIPKDKAENLPYLFKHNQRTLMEAATRNEVSVDEELKKKLSAKIMERSLSQPSPFSAEEADELLIELL